MELAKIRPKPMYVVLPKTTVFIFPFNMDLESIENLKRALSTLALYINT